MYIRQISSRIKVFRFLFSQSTKESDSTHFGFKNVNMNEKQGMVNSVFDSVASKYDIMNDLMSLGIHRCWKETFVDDIGLLKPSKLVQDNVIIEKPAVVLDVAGGTGDISFKILEKHKERKSHLGNLGLQIICLDINENMLEGGKLRAAEKGYKETGF